MQQFFVEALKPPYLNTKQHQQCKKVLRMKQGDQIRLVDGEGNGVLAQFSDDSLDNLDILEPLEWAPKKRSLTLIASLIRSERLEWMIQKACECGVDRIVLLRAEHGVVRDFGARADRKMERFNMIAQEACEQAYRQHLVEVHDIIEADEIHQFKSDCNVYADVGIHEHLVNFVSVEDASVSIVIGSEGGYSDKERQSFESQGFQAVSMGNHVYRAETASIVACNIIEVVGVIK